MILAVTKPVKTALEIKEDTEKGETVVVVVVFEVEVPEMDIKTGTTPGREEINMKWEEIV